MEEALGERVVARNESFVALVPFWAVWPFEVMILPRRHVERLEDFTDMERSDFAAILRAVTSTYDKVFDTPFPYSMGLHPAPYDGEKHPEWQFHVHFYPPLLRSARIRKFMVGYELLGSPQRDITPESAAETLAAGWLSCCRPGELENVVNPAIRSKLFSSGGVALCRSMHFE